MNRKLVILRCISDLTYFYVYLRTIIHIKKILKYSNKGKIKTRDKF